VRSGSCSPCTTRSTSSTCACEWTSASSHSTAPHRSRRTKTSTVSRAAPPRAGDRWADAAVHDEEGRQQIRTLFGALDRLKKLDELHASGVLTDEEFETKKAPLLAEI
jgi:hypothetical protein